MNAIETFEHAGKVIEIHVDEDPQNPREECDHACQIVCFHKRYRLPNETDYKKDDFNSWDELEDRIKKDNNVLAILPIYMYDHSGITIATTPFSCPWDSGQIGFIFVTKEKAKEWKSFKRVTKKLVAWAEGCLTADIKEYSQFLEGDCYGYIVKQGDEELDSCWGFYGIENVREQAKDSAESIKVEVKEAV
jgi:hypothetical protein